MAQVFIVRHPGPLSSVAEHLEDGRKSLHYYRPPNEATLVYQPRQGLVEVCATRLGNPTNPAEAAALGREVSITEADRFATNVLPLIGMIQAAGVTSLRGIARALNARGVPTARGGRWQVSNVRNVLNRQKVS